MEEPVSTEKLMVFAQPQKRFPTKRIVIAIVVLILIFFLALLISLLFKKGRLTTKQTLTPAPSSKPLFIEQDVFGGSVLGSKWYVDYIGGAYNVNVENGNLVINIPGGGPSATTVIVTLSHLINNDFETSIDVDLNESSLGSVSAFVFHTDEVGWPNRFGFYLTKNTSEEIILHVYSVVDGQEKELAATSLPANKRMKLAIGRKSDGVDFSIDGNLFAQGNGIYLGEGRISMVALSEAPKFPNVKCLFDNFTYK